MQNQMYRLFIAYIILRSIHQRNIVQQEYVSEGCVSHLGFIYIYTFFYVKKVSFTIILFQRHFFGNPWTS